MPGVLKIAVSRKRPEELLATVREHTPYQLEFSREIQSSCVYDLFNQLREHSQPFPEAFLWKGLTDSFFQITVEEAVLCVSKVLRKSPETMRHLFTDGQRIRHYVKRKNDYWVGTYSAKQNKIVRDNKSYTLSDFASSHVKTLDPSRKTGVSGWDQCECKVGDEWIHVNEYASRVL